MNIDNTSQDKSNSKRKSKKSREKNATPFCYHAQEQRMHSDQNCCSTPAHYFLFHPLFLTGEGGNITTLQFHPNLSCADQYCRLFLSNNAISGFSIMSIIMISFSLIQVERTIFFCIDHEFTCLREMSLIYSDQTGHWSISSNRIMLEDYLCVGKIY